MPPSTSLDHDPSAAPGRRRVLSIFVNAVLAAVGSGLAALLGVFGLRPAAKAASDRWMRAASLLELKPGTPVPRVLTVRRADGWYRNRSRVTVFLVRDGDDVRALSATCTHLGCQVRWDRDAKRFLCPCHGGAYDAHGRVIEGPPPRPLDAVAVRVDAAGNSVMVRV